VIVRSGFHPHVWYRNSGDIFRRNIVGAVYQPARMGPPPWGAEMDHNLLHVPGQSEPTPAARLAAQSGRDVHSLAADARFVAPERGDFRVRAGSPALALGFVNFPMDRFGVRKPSLKAIARTPDFAPPVVAPGSGNAAPSTTTWLGARVRTLTTTEEASSLGVALANGGVVVIEVPVGSTAAGAGLQSGDLIVGAQGQTVQSVADLARLDGSRKPADGELRIIRDQRPRTLPSPP
jgi:hypothetical protein